jgi:hypothetical protein
MWRMRVAALAALVLAVAGCGGSAQTAGTLDNEAAHLVPANAIAFVSADSRFDSAGWRTITNLIGPVDGTAELAAAVGDQLNLAALPSADGPEVVAIVKPKDEAKLRAYAAKFNEKNGHYTVQHVNGWSVVADSADVFAAVRAAASGRSLADVGQFQQASAQLDHNALATAYASGAALKSMDATLARLVDVSGSPAWIDAQLVPQDNAARIELRTAGPTKAAAYHPTLLRDVPSGAIAAVSFKDLDRPLAKLPGLARTLQLGVPVSSLLPALRGEGVAYLLQGTLVPTFVFEVQSPDPAAAVKALHVAAKEIETRLNGALTLRVARYGSRVVLTNSPPGAATSGGSLVDDQPYKDALAAAGAPDRVTFLAYADVQRLQPFLQLLKIDTKRLDKIGTAVAFGTPSSAVLRATLK